jgi:3-isopropylmalate/(R)-2-methylmalate dehydratase small subunit
MQPFQRLDAVAVPLPSPNIDTDQIIPARFLWRKRSDSWEHLLFHDLRYYDDGSPKPEFQLNRAEYARAQIAVAGRNFGCGSSREHAVWSLYGYGIRCVIAPSFGDIFANNCFQNGLLPVVQPEDRVAGLLALLANEPGMRMTVDLERQRIGWHDGEIGFDIDPFRKECLLAGTDDIGFTLSLIETIEAFEKAYERAVPWIKPLSHEPSSPALNGPPAEH